MASPNTNYTEIISTTLDNYRDTLADNVTNNNALLVYMKKNGNADPAAGGAKLLENLMYEDNGTLNIH